VISFKESFAISFAIYFVGIELFITIVCLISHESLWLPWLMAAGVALGLSLLSAAVNSR
jgi:hypothetical protein